MLPRCNTKNVIVFKRLFNIVFGIFLMRWRHSIHHSRALCFSIVFFFIVTCSFLIFFLHSWNAFCSLSSFLIKSDIIPLISQNAKWQHTKNSFAFYFKWCGCVVKRIRFGCGFICVYNNLLYWTYKQQNV